MRFPSARFVFYINKLLLRQLEDNEIAIPFSLLEPSGNVSVKTPKFVLLIHDLALLYTVVRSLALKVLARGFQTGYADSVCLFDFTFSFDFVYFLM